MTPPDVPFDDASGEEQAFDFSVPACRLALINLGLNELALLLSEEGGDELDPHDLSLWASTVSDLLRAREREARRSLGPAFDPDVAHILKSLHDAGILSSDEVRQALGFAARAER